MFVRNDSKIFRFCRSKCRKNFHMKRNPRKLKWTKSYRKSAGKEMTVDATFDFEKRRNRPEKYDRNVMAKTLKAMKEVQRIQKSREDRFYMNRMKANKSREKDRVKMDIEKNIDLVAPAMSKARKQIEETVLAKQREKADERAAAAKGDAAKEASTDMDV